MIPPADLVGSFLKAAAADGIAATVVYAFTNADGKHERFISANVGADGIQTALAWLERADHGAVEAAAKILFAAGGHPPPNRERLEVSWRNAPEPVRKSFIALAAEAIRAAVDSKPKIIDGAAPPTPRAPPILVS